MKGNILADFQICISVSLNIGLLPPIMKKDLCGKCNLRRKTEFEKSNVETMYYGTETSIFLGPKILEIVQEDSLKKTNDFDGFKLKIRL